MTTADEGRLLSKKSYEVLLRQVATLVQDAAHKQSATKLASTWNIGRRIQSARLSQNAGYHNTVIRDLAADIGVSKRSLQESVTFFDAYDSPPEDSPLTWSHFRQLMRLPKKERDHFQKLAIKNSWSARELSGAIEQAALEAIPQDGPLPRPTDPTYLYAAKVRNIVDGDTLDVDIDLGFEVTRHLRLRLANIDTPPLETPPGRAARDYLTRALHSCQTVAITTERVDLHGRYVAHLFTSPQKIPTLSCFESGKYLNAALITADHARIAPR